MLLIIRECTGGLDTFDGEALRMLPSLQSLVVRHRLNLLPRQERHGIKRAPSVPFLRLLLAPHIYSASRRDRKSTRLNSSHSQISYAVFCLKKKKTTNKRSHTHLRTQNATRPHPPHATPDEQVHSDNLHVLDADCVPLDITHSRRSCDDGA